MFTEQQFYVNGTSLNAAVGPTHGPPIVFLHGVIRRWQDFGNQMPALAARWRVVAVDHRGHGKSSREKRYFVADYIADTLALIRGFDEPAILIGHSLGALTALGVAAEAPEAVRAIVLEDPPSSRFLTNLRSSPYFTQFEAMRNLAGTGRPIAELARTLSEIRLPGGIRLGDRRDPVSLRFLARCLADLDPAVLTPVLEDRWLDGFEILSVAAATRCPALLLVGDTAQGGMLAPPDADDLASALPDSVRMNRPGVGHLIHAIQPDAYLQMVTTFLDSI
ncbi:MAG: alpha/beta hydrolase [Planctomycetes bacterium]|nr:alpha/beta hydrolase [Planctomycetota bacterium]